MALLLISNLTLLLPNGNTIRVIGALLLIGLLPGLGWSFRFFRQTSRLMQFVTAVALGYTLTSLSILLLHYLPGPVVTWQLVAVLNIFAILPVVFTGRDAAERRSGGEKNLPSALQPLRTLAPLLLILLIALFLRAANLNYSEFQGDEALAMIAAAEALEGHEDALFLRSKGPGEVLLPMAMWRLTGAITEAVARLPFTVAAIMAVITIYLIGRQLGGNRLGWLAAGFFALNGFMVAFGRIVQYQALVVWMSALAFLLALHWNSARQLRFAAVSGLSLGTGLLAHYDAILALPALGWLFVAPPIRAVIHRQTTQWGRAAKALVIFAAAFLLTTLPFYLPFIFDPQAGRTGDYVGARIGNELRNNLPDFFHFNSFYSSFYYIFFTGLLVPGFLIWILWQTGRWWRAVAVAGAAGIVAVAIKPALLAGPPNLSALPFGVTLLAAFLACFHPKLREKAAASADQINGVQATIIWLAVPFLGYNFVVALGLTHIYTIVPAWSLLAALGWQRVASLIERPGTKASPGNRQAKISNGILVGLMLLSTIFLWNAFVRHDVEYWQDYPQGQGNIALFWSPFQELPEAGFFGFAHRAGWKSVGQKIVEGHLSGDYGSNEEPDVTTWYTRGAPRGCDPHPEFYFLADDLIDPVEISADTIEAGYAEIGAVQLPNQKQMQLLQQKPASLALGHLDDATLARQFDQTALPAAFARSARGALPANANFGNLAQLIGYDLDTRRAWPGGRVPVTLYWQALSPIKQSYQVFTHLESETGPVAQSDGVPVCWTYPTDAWRPGQIIADQHAIALPQDVQPGRYPLEIGLYLPDTFQRLDVLDMAGNPAGTGVTLTEIEIRAQ